MTLYFMYLLILIITFLLFVIIKDKIKALKLTGTLTISSSILLLILTFITKIIINVSVTTINLSSITNYIFKKFLYTSLILFIIGLIEIMISKYINTKKRIKA